MEDFPQKIIGLSVDRSVSRSVGRSVCLSVCLSVGRSVKPAFRKKLAQWQPCSSYGFKNMYSTTFQVYGQIWVKFNTVVLRVNRWVSQQAMQCRHVDLTAGSRKVYFILYSFRPIGKSFGSDDAHQNLLINCQFVITTRQLERWNNLYCTCTFLLHCPILVQFDITGLQICSWAFIDKCPENRRIKDRNFVTGWIKAHLRVYCEEGGL